MPAHSVSALLDSRSPLRRGLRQAGGHPGAGHAPDDGRVAIPALAFLRCLRPGLPARGVSRQWYPLALGQYEPGVRPVPPMGGVSTVASTPGDASHAETQVANLSDAGWQARAPVLLPLAADARRLGRIARPVRGSGFAAGARRSRV